MILHRYSPTGLYIVSTDYPDNAAIPPLSTFLPPPDLTPNEAPYAVFRQGAWRLEDVKPTAAIYSSLPDSVMLEAFQAKVVLAQYGLLPTVQALVNHPNTPIRVKLAWDNAVPFRRDNPLVLLIAQQLSLSVETLDELFSVGATITTETI